jgi:PelA/Pel-15E family pectate lyase
MNTYRLLLGLLFMPLAASAAGKPLHVVLVGDSTVTEGSGWGRGFSKFVDDVVTVTNVAQNGRSSKSYRDEGWWDKAIALHGDYYLIQFGHNDQPGKGPARETDPETTFAANLARYVDEVRAIGAKPVLVTSLVRRTFSKSDPTRLESAHVPYVAALLRVAQEKSVPVIDLHARSLALCESMGPAETAKFDFPDAKGKIDTTHLQEEGSTVFGRLVAEDFLHILPPRVAALITMKRATRFMVEKVSCEGGYVWSYLPDLSRRWGEMEANPTMIWIQAPGTPAMGQGFLDAYQATGDEYYYQVARKTADALIRVQHPSGGWNYVADFAGEESLQQWYATVGHNGWRLEEFQHYYGNATFDDRTTIAAADFLLQFYAQKRDEKYRPALDRAIRFVLDSQYPSGGWPQRFPLMAGFAKQGHPDYTGFITFNDDVVAENIDFLIACYRQLEDPRLLEPIRRGMDVTLATLQPSPQAGWAMQYTTDLQPAGARTYEPKALTTHTTARNIDQLIRFYYLTGDRKFLTRIPDALAWLDSVQLPKELAGARGTHPTFLELGTNRPLYLHRTGSNVVNGRYYADYDPQNTIGHYNSFRSLDTPALRARYEKAVATPPEEAVRGSPLKSAAGRVRKTQNQSRAADEEPVSEARVARIIGQLNAEGYWPTPLRSTSHPYCGDGAAEVTPRDFSRTMVGDETDTSPYFAAAPVMGISVGAYLRNMDLLVRYLESQP